MTNTFTPSWDDLRMLLAVHRDRSFLLAAKTLGVATSTVSRRIEALEKSLGRPLVHRGNDGTRLDPDALRLVALGEEFELGLDALRRDGSDDAVTGTVRLSMSEGFVRPVTQVMARLRVKYPALAVELMSESRMVDLARREADIGVRISKTTSSAVVSRFMGRAQPALFASRDYVQRRLPSAKLSREAAALQDWVGFDASLERLPQEKWVRAYGAKNFVFRSNASIAIEQAVLSGIGIGLLMEGHAAPSLVQLDVDDTPPAVEVYLAFHRDSKKTPRVRTVVRELEAEFRRQLR
ncbi:MAG: LysR family transcriptional regulator [Archangium gephyra]|uniref:LysR family transcriptional regulator n=1 Tax=Archangium gephyra TaxID=48 RepID=A0A2W5SWN9_9BACT|nr:MAG: LysR family transcriptional regulator [Archangium gephyra]